MVDSGAETPEIQAVRACFFESASVLGSILRDFPSLWHVEGAYSRCVAKLVMYTLRMGPSSASQSGYSNFDGSSVTV